MVINKLSAEHKSMIEEYISHYAFSDNMNNKNSNRKPIDYILRIWDRDKEDLFKMLGEELIISKEISYEMGSEELFDEMSNIINCGERTLVGSFVQSFKNLYRWNGIYYGNHHLQSLMYCENLTSNIYNGETFYLDLPSGKKLKIQNGIKTIKAISKIAKAFELPFFEEFRIAHSMVLNQKTLSGKLHLSIHPLDFMTMSDNDCCWDSCMNWRDVGDYRRGTVECMNSPMVIVAYLSSEKEMNLFNWRENSSTWNNKKWRQLFVVTPEIITGIKGYPYRNNDLEKIVLDWIKELAEKNLDWKYFKNTCEWSNHNTVKNKYFPDGICVAAYSNIMYNDCGSHQTAYFSSLTPNYYKFNYSGESECMCCGEVAVGFGNASDLVCDDCEPKMYCYCCGDRIYEGDDYYIVDGKPVCGYCNENMEYCAICGKSHLDGEAKQLHLARDEEHIFRGVYIPVCWDNCDDTWKIYDKRVKWYGNISYVLLDEIDDYQLDLFDSGTREELKNDESCAFYELN